MLVVTETPHSPVNGEQLLVDEPVTVRVVGVKSGQLVHVCAESTDSRSALHRSWAYYRADANGVVDLSRLAPLAGTYTGADPFGLWWSMTPINGDPFARMPGRFPLR